MTEEYSKADYGEIMIQLKKLFEYMKKLKQLEKNEEELANTPIPGN